MQENAQAKGDSQKPTDPNRNFLRATQALFKRLPIGMRRIINAALFGFAFIVAIAVFHPSLNERWKFGTDMTLNLLILFAITIQAYIYSGQWSAMRDGLERTDRVIDKMQLQLEAIDKQEVHLLTQAKAATTAAEMATGQLVAMQHTEQAQFAQLEAMKEQAKTMKRSLVQGTRAYLGVHSLDFDVENKRIFLHIENIGKVPAKNIEVVVEIKAEVPNTKYEAFCRSPQRYDWAEKNGERHLQIPRLFPYGRTKLFPGSLKIPVMVRLDDSPYISDEQFSLISGGYAKLRVQGVITYSDGFHSGKKTEFAFRYFAKNRKSPWVPQPVEGLEFQADREQPDSDYNPN